MSTNVLRIQLFICSLQYSAVLLSKAQEVVVGFSIPHLILSNWTGVLSEAICDRNLFGSIATLVKGNFDYLSQENLLKQKIA